VNISWHCKYFNYFFIFIYFFFFKKKNIALNRYGYCQRPSGFSVILRWEDHNLQTYLAEHKDLDWIEKLSISRGIANALNFCHEKDVLHYDIRTLVFFFFLYLSRVHILCADF
jgi:hypothetical protein